MADFQNNLWAPWRIEYIRGLAPGDAGECFLCRAAAEPQAKPAEPAPSPPVSGEPPPKT